MAKTKKFSKLEASTISSLIFPGERLVVYATERPLHGGLFNPTVVMVTDQRTIIVNRKYMRLKSNITFIEHTNVVSYRVFHSLVFSTVVIRQQGASDSEHLFTGIGEGEIKGLSRIDTNAVANAISYYTHIKKTSAEPSHEEIKIKQQHELANNRIVYGPGMALPDWERKHNALHHVTNIEHARSASAQSHRTVTSISPNGMMSEQLKVELPSEEIPPMPQVEMMVVQATNSPSHSTVTSMAPSEPARMQFKTEPTTVEAPSMPHVEFITRNTNLQDTVAQPVNPEDLMIFKVRKAREAMHAQELVSESWSGEYPSPDQILVGDRPAGKSSMFHSLLNSVTPVVAQAKNTPPSSDQKPAVHHVNPDDLQIFKARKVKEEPRTLEPVSDNWSGTHPSPDQILMAGGRKSKPSLFSSLLSRILPGA